MKTKNTKLS